MTALTTFNQNLENSPLKAGFQSCVDLFQLYEAQVARRPVSADDSTRMTQLHSSILAFAGDAQMNALVREVRDSATKGNYCYMHRQKVFLSQGYVSAGYWRDEAAILNSAGISPRELARCKAAAQKRFGRAPSGALHPLHGEHMLTNLLGSLRTLEVVSVSAGFHKLGKSGRKFRQPLILADKARLRAAIFLLANTIAHEGRQHEPVFRISYALAVSDAALV